MAIDAIELATDPDGVFNQGAYAAIDAVTGQEGWLDLLQVASNGNLRGSALYFAFEHCGRSGYALAEAIRSRDPAMQRAVNAELRKSGMIGERWEVFLGPPPRTVTPPPGFHPLG